MPIVFDPASLRRGAVVLALALAPALPALAQVPDPTPQQASDWKQANAVVGAFQRGHADLLKWEQAHIGAPQPSAATLPALGVDDVVRKAWQRHPTLAQVQARLGDVLVQQIASGRWIALDPSLRRRVDDMDELLEVAVQARKAWLDAVATRQVLRQRQASLEAAQAALALGQRMVTVGNWSRLQLSPVLLAEAQARMDVQRARYAAAQAQASLVKLLGVGMVEPALPVPDELPALAPEAEPESAWLHRAAAVQAQLPGAERMRNRALAMIAIQAYLAAHAVARDNRDVVLKERTFITEETVLHYNGMLKSVWDLLEATRSQAQAAVDAIGAQRDFWVAEADLQWVLQGGEPERLVALGAGGADAPQAAGH